VVFHWLRRPSAAARIVTIHELDPHQLEFPAKNRIYNAADAVIVHCEEMKERLVKLGVQPKRIHVVLQGVEIPAVEPGNDRREAIVFYGGHKLMTGKGIQTLFKAMALLKQRLGADAPTLKIHGHYGDEVPEEAKRLALQHDIADKVVWLNQISFEEIGRQYRSSAVCVLPYTGGFAGLPASIAAANGLPVVCTRKAGLTDHLGECGIWVQENDAEQLAGKITELLNDERLRQEVSQALCKRAKQFLSLDAVADRTLDVYGQALKKKGNVHPSAVSVAPAR
jgi:glycosyltransferase involved in cell wall biosynthesis